jgi:hypothetical protein
LGLTGCFNTLQSTEKVDLAAAAKWTVFDYTDWKEVLKSHVNESGLVDYQTLKEKRILLDRFVALIANVGPNSRPDLFKSKHQQLAYYINAYNALTMFNVINGLPTLKSVNDNLKTFFYFTEFVLDGEAVSLYVLENKMIRPTFEEPRIHFALNCASTSCPRLPNTPFLPETLDAQLNRETDYFLREKRNVTTENGTLVLSSIFKWYTEDFPPTPYAWIKKRTKNISLPAPSNIKYRPYDWSLNSQ